MKKTFLAAISFQPFAGQFFPPGHLPRVSSLIAAADKLRKALRPLSFPEPVAYTYHPLDYAWERHCDYLRRFGQGHKRVLMLGMNPGSYVPFLQD